MRRDHRDAIVTVGPVDLLDDLVTTDPAQVDVEVGKIAGATLVEEALEVQAVDDGIDVRDPEGVGHQRAGTRAASHDLDAAPAGPGDQVADHEEVGREAEAIDHLELPGETAEMGRGNLLIAGVEPGKGQAGQEGEGRFLLAASHTGPFQ